MTLLDPKHLLSPFKNTVHLIAIVFIVLLFAVYRMATGGVDVSSRGEEASPPQAQTSAPQVAEAAAQAQPVAAASAEAAPGKNTASPNEAADLKDIERALGLTK